MRMDLIKKYLSRFTALAPPGDAVRRVLQESLEDEFGEHIDRAAISVVGTVVKLRASPVLKSELFLRKKQIILQVNQKLNNQSHITDIR